MKTHKFDICLMNPPYGSGGSVYIKFIHECLDICDKQIVICPASWAQDYFVIQGVKKSPKIRYVKMLGPYLENYTLFHVTDFQETMNIGGWRDGMIGIFRKNNENRELYKEISKIGLTPYDYEMIYKVAMPIYTKKFKSILSQYSRYVDYDDTYVCFIKLSRVHGHVNYYDMYDTISPDIKFALNIPDNEQKQVYFKTHDEAVNFFNTLNTEFCKYLKKINLFGRDVNACLPFMGDYTHEWTNEQLFDYFHISEETRQYIKQFFTQFYSNFDK